MPAHAAAAAHVLWLPQHRTLTRLLRAAPQIRLHLAHAGHAILGDDLYGVTGGRTAEKHLPGCCICLWPCCRWQVQGLISHSRSASLLAAFYRLSLLPQPPPAHPDAGPWIGRHALHAAALHITHPRTGEPITVRAPLPPDFLEAMQQLGLRLPEGH